LDTYIPVDIHTFRNPFRDIHFDVYLKLSDDNYAHVFSRATGIDYIRLAQYIAKGVKELYIRTEDEAIYREFTKMVPEEVLNNPQTSHETKLTILVNMTDQNIAEVFAQLNIAEDTTSNAKRLLKNYLHLMLENPKSVALLLQMVSHREYLYYHSVSVAVFSVFLAKAAGLFNQSMLELIGLGGFLHDIGMTRLSKDILYSSKEPTVAQWKEIRNHPRVGLQMLEKVPNIPDEVRYMVYQHHESPNGKGYPNGLHDQAINYPAKIVAVADGFSALISKRPFRPAYSVEQAIHILETETGKRDRELVRLMGSIFIRQTAEKKAT
jgi:putative nucleotidyltransferase with HDIG domain